MEHAMTRREFDVRDLGIGWYLTAGFCVFMLMSMSASLFIQSDVRYPLAIIFAALAVVLQLMRLVGLAKTGKLIVDDEKLVCYSRELKPGEIDKITLAYGTLSVKRKNRRWTYIHLSLKRTEEFERLRDRIAEFAGKHNITVEIVK